MDAPEDGPLKPIVKSALQQDTTSVVSKANLRRDGLLPLGEVFSKHIHPLSG
jgi:hypothetical protein